MNVRAKTISLVENELKMAGPKAEVNRIELYSDSLVESVKNEQFEQFEDNTFELQAHACRVMEAALTELQNRT
ncbi:hypothetical protein PCE1_000608 [Barthelona sp. PCE]